MVIKPPLASMVVENNWRIVKLLNHRLSKSITVSGCSHDFIMTPALLNESDTNTISSIGSKLESVIHCPFQNMKLSHRHTKFHSFFQPGNINLAHVELRTRNKKNKKTSNLLKLFVPTKFFSLFWEAHFFHGTFWAEWKRRDSKKLVVYGKESETTKCIKIIQDSKWQIGRDWEKIWYRDSKTWSISIRRSGELSKLTHYFNVALWKVIGTEKKHDVLLTLIWFRMHRLSNSPLPFPTFQPLIVRSLPPHWRSALIYTFARHDTLLYLFCRVPPLSHRLFMTQFVSSLAVYTREHRSNTRLTTRTGLHSHVATTKTTRDRKQFRLHRVSTP